MQPNEMRKMRKEAGLSQGELADIVGLSLGFIGEMERGEKPIELRTELALHEALDRIKPIRVTVGTFAEQYVMVVTERHPGMAGRVHRVIPPGYDTLQQATNAAEKKAEELGVTFIHPGNI